MSLLSSKKRSITITIKIVTQKLNIPFLSFQSSINCIFAGPIFFLYRIEEEKGKKRKKKREQGAKRARKLGTGSREDERKLLKARQGMIYISFQSFALKMVNALNDGINNCIQRTAGIDLKTPVRGTPVEYPCNDLVRHSSGRREIVCE